MIEIKNMTASEMDFYIRDLSSLLVDCVEEGASLGFLSPVKESEAEQYWRAIKASVKEGKAFLHVAFIDSDVQSNSRKTVTG